MTSQPKTVRSSLERLFSANFDLQVAECAGNQIIRRAWHDTGDADERFIHWCVNMAMTVSYWRPFSRGGWIPVSLLDCYSVAEMALHKRVGALRNEAHAHSNPKVLGWDLMVIPGSGCVPRWENQFEPMPRDDVRTLVSMIGRLRAAIATESTRLESSLVSSGGSS